MKEKKSDWVKIKPAELEKIILDLHKEGNSPSKIGLVLRDKHGVPKARLLGKKVTQILAENKVKFTTEKEIAANKIQNVEKHISAHKHDYTAKRSLTKRLWAIKKLS